MSKKTQLKKESNLIEEKLIESQSTLADKFVYMEKGISILDVGLKTNKNVILYGSGGHGKSELTLDFFLERGIEPYIITMGTGMTTDRLFGGLDIPTFEKTGKIEYLVENSFMNHEYVIFEEMMDAPDFILEQLKDIISSGVFRNGTQMFEIKTKFIVCCTNRTRDEFSKNQSLRALMERFPLELNIIWDVYNEITYTRLLQSRFGDVDPIIPFILQEYAKQSITISPRIAIVAYELYLECGPESLVFLADFAKKPAIIKDAISKYESSIAFRELSSKTAEAIQSLQDDDMKNQVIYKNKLEDLESYLNKLKVLKVSDNDASKHAQIVKNVEARIKEFKKKSDIFKLADI